MRPLTIAIPTFDRDDSLAKSLPGLLEQVARHPDVVEVLIVDNASPKPVAETIESILAQFPGVSVRLVRNRTNIGGHGNMLRAFELTETPWLWLLGDDDLLTPNALETVLAGLEKHPKAIFHNYTFDVFDRPEAFVTKGQDEFVEKVDSFPTLLFTSVGVYRLDAFLPHLRFGYLYSYSWGPHIALLLASVGDEGQFYFGTEKLVGQHQLDDRKKYWSVLNVMMGMPVLADLPMKPQTRKSLAIFLGKQLQQEQLPYHLIQNWKLDGDLDYALYTYDHIVFRNYYFGSTLAQKLKRFLYRWLVRFPKAGEAIIRTGYPLIAKRLAKGKSIEQIDVPKRWGRV
jgi:glycosyltransferase involved in cell wall biosynthesis